MTVVVWQVFFRRMIYLKCKTQRYLTSVALCMKWVTINLISRLFIDLSHLYIISAHTFSSCFLLLNHRASLLSNATKRKTTKQRMGNGMQVMMRTVQEDWEKRKLLVQNYAKHFKPTVFLIEKKTLQVLRRNNNSFLTHIIRLFTLKSVPKSSQFTKESWVFLEFDR